MSRKSQENVSFQFTRTHTRAHIQMQGIFLGDLWGISVLLQSGGNGTSSTSSTTNPNTSTVLHIAKVKVPFPTTGGFPLMA